MQIRALLLASLLVATASLVAGHAERDVEFPDGEQMFAPPEYRAFAHTDGHAHHHDHFVVCQRDNAGEVLWDGAVPAGFSAADMEHLAAECGYTDIQSAVDAVTRPGSNIYVFPGTYREEPSRAAPTGDCARFAPQINSGILDYHEHVECPTIQALIHITGDDPADADIACDQERLCDLQIEGLGMTPRDTLVTAEFSRLNAIRIDRADGFYLRNMHFKETEFNAVYVLQTDGVVIQDVVASNNWEYGILTFAVDSVLIERCEAYTNGDSGVYPGSASEYPGDRFAVEIRHCDLYDNALGYSGTAGNNVWVHHNKFHHNAAGIAMDSLFPGHPGLPQDSSLFEYNEIYSNNVNHYINYGYYGKEDYCGRPVAERGIEDGTVCPVIPLPVGTGLLVAGGNNNTFRNNWVYDNHRYGMMLFTVPAFFRDEHGGADVLCAADRLTRPDPVAALECLQDFDAERFQEAMDKQFDTSHWNEFYDNNMGYAPDGSVAHNGLDFWWDEGGAGNCWQDNRASGGLVLSEPAVLPLCHVGEEGSDEDKAHHESRNLTRPISPRLAAIVPCNFFDKNDDTGLFNPPLGCDWMTTPPPPTEVMGVRLPYTNGQSTPGDVERRLNEP